MSTLMRYFMGVASTAVCSAVLATPSNKTCAEPKTGTADSISIVIVDRTQSRDQVMNDGVVSVAAKTAKPGTRLLLWSVGGTVRPLPSLVADVTLPRLAERKDNLSSLIYKLSQPEGAIDAIELCARNYVANLVDDYLKKLKNELAIADGTNDENAISPILSAINAAVSSFQKEAAAGMVKIMVVSDGIEHTLRLSFYPSKEGTYLKPDAVVQQSSKAHPGRWNGAQIHFAGLGNSINRDPALIAEMTGFWAQIIAARGGVVGELSPSVPQRF
jgi:hypothetical protein